MGTFSWFLGTHYMLSTVESPLVESTCIFDLLVGVVGVVGVLDGEQV